MKSIRPLAVVATIALLAVPVMAHAQLLGKFGDGILQAEMFAHLPIASPTLVIVALMRWILSIVGFFAIIALAYAGILYLTSTGDEEQATRGKKTALYAVVGLIVAISGIILINAINSLLMGRSSF